MQWFLKIQWENFGILPSKAYLTVRMWPMSIGWDRDENNLLPWTGTKNATCRIGITFRYLLGSIWNFKGFQILFVRTSGTIFAAWVAQNSSQRKHFFQRHHIFKHAFCMCQTVGIKCGLENKLLLCRGWELVLMPRHGPWFAYGLFRSHWEWGWPRCK